MTTTITHPSGLPEQEPTSPTAVVLCDGETWVKTGADWESLGYLCSWGDLRDFAAGKGGATLYDLADLPTGLTGVQKEAIRSAWSALTVRGSNVSAGVLRDAFPEVFADDLVSATWESGDSYETWADLLRVACMDGASVVGTQSGVTYSGLVFAAHSDHISIGCTSTGTPPLAIPQWGVGWTITVTAPKPADPTGGDPVVLAADIYTNRRALGANEAKKCVFFRAEDGKWSIIRGAIAGVWTTDQLTDIERLSGQAIAELVGGAA